MKWALVPAVCLALVCVVRPAAAAGDSGQKWHTCTAGSMHLRGPYRIYDNAWLGHSSKRFCVESTGLNISIESSARPVGSMVVAYPSIRYGRFFGDLDPKSGLPLPIPGLGRRPVILHVSSTGHATGVWQSSLDAWFIPSASWTGHGITELVIVNRTSSGTSRSRASRSGTRIRISGVRYRLVSWMTCQRLPGGRCDSAIPQWRLIYLSRVRQTAHSVINLGRIIRKLIARHLLSRREWLGDVAYGTELWSGGRGLTDTMTVGSAT